LSQRNWMRRIARGVENMDSKIRRHRLPLAQLMGRS